MIPVYYIAIPFIIAMLLTFWIHPYVLRVAIKKNIVDNPDARKLQRVPVPILGGIAVFFGVLCALGCMAKFLHIHAMLIILVTIMVMLYTGTIDDILGLSPRLRFLIEILVVGIFIYASQQSINDFHGLWGINQIPNYLAFPLTVFACVGIINAINLIDGINGLSSGFCIIACTIFCTMFSMAGNIDMAILAAACVGALIPFFMHNVFGKETKMFIGDGGALIMGLVLSIFVITVLNNGSLCSQYYSENVGLVPFTLAVLSVPVFDTLRVMTTRILNGKSPFDPDKTHLHHILISLSKSHIIATTIILLLSVFIVLIWLLLVYLGASIEIQLYVVLVLGLSVTVGLYKFLENPKNHNSLPIRITRKIVGRRSYVRRRRRYLRTQKMVDKL